MKTIRVLVAGLGNMGLSHARAYKAINGFEIAGLCSRGIAGRDDLKAEFPGVPQFNDYAEALATLTPDAVSINTWPDTHAAYARLALEAGAHVFIEKPLADTVAEAQEIAALAKRKRLKLVIGYILRVHPSWVKFVEVGRSLGKPLVMRMNLNQQSSGAQWQVHRHLMNSISPIVDCGVHYVDVMCQVTGAKPTSVHAVGARLTSEIDAKMYNYGHLHVTFDDGSVGWYEAGWGPMMSETAFFVKDMIGPSGSVSIAMEESKTQSADVDSHTKTSALRLHHGLLNPEGQFVTPDEIISMDDEPGHQELCNREQMLFLDAIRNDRNMDRHVEDAISSLRIVLAADHSVRTGEVVRL
ncbi:MAG: Gfo/Idh/MocA family oxidoreductase [Aestuariivirga sp.]|uniref:Gfo/Idh/MocA family protein n=1 Tax=Aestuariivirga sp. TaxID=2650926 RepID=UPI0025BC0D82|nr:Gfo/Idh/MocA family oxidoreductase [Aestuariivirga sp.]MCA3561127.1 Gfo/Idh/MocA family oxidoreductase [Aestuariivirga sp.]